MTDGFGAASIDLRGRVAIVTGAGGGLGRAHALALARHGAAKMALVGLMRTLSLEGQRHDIRVNCLAPSAATRMTAEIMPAETLARLGPDTVAPVVVALAADDAPSGVILCAGGGRVERAYVTLTREAALSSGPDAAARLLADLDRISDRTGEIVPGSGAEQAAWEAGGAMERAA